MTARIEALYIFDDQRQCILDHIYNGRPPKPSELRTSFLSHPSPQPSILYLLDLQPPTTAYSIWHANLLLIATCTVETQSLAILEFLRKVVDIFEDFLGSPLLSNKVEENYEVVAQLLTEVCDGGIICNTEPNALRDTVEVSSVLGKLFNQVGLPSSAPSIGGPAALSSSLKPSLTPSNQPSIPWRRPNVRHTSNELYVDILESLHVISSPSGRPISARATGSILFTAKISGVPDILLSLNAPGGTSQAKHSGIQRTMALPSFHPCVRLNRWSENPGELSFIPPDGKFMLAGYEVDLLPYSFDTDTLPTRGSEGKLFLPATVDLRTGLGPTGMDFEAKVTLNTNFPGTNKQSSSTNFTSSSIGSSARPTALTNSRNNSGPPSTLSGSSPFSFGPSTTGTTSAPTLDSVTVTIPFPTPVRNVTELRPSRGDATFNIHTKTLEWKIPTTAKDAGSISGTATLSGSISGPLSTSASASNLHDFDDDDNDNDIDTTDPTMTEYYTSSPTTNKRSTRNPASRSTSAMPATSKNRSKKHLLPRTIAASFTVKGWLPSGIKVDALSVDVKKSRGLGDGVKPYKGVKYVCVSRRGVERRVDLR